MAANILNSGRAVQMSIVVVRAFSKMRQQLATNAAMTEKLNELERKLAGRLQSTTAATTLTHLYWQRNRQRMSWGS